MPRTDKDPGFEPSCRRVLEEMHPRGRQRWETLEVPREEYVRRAFRGVLRRLEKANEPPTPERLRAECSAIEGADLYLAMACESGSADAWQQLVETFAPPLRSLALQQGAGPAEAEELTLGLPGDLLTSGRPGRERTQLAGYDGSGRLLSWLSVLLLRKLWHSRRAGPRNLGEPDDRLDPAPGAMTDAVSADTAAANAVRAIVAEEDAERFGAALRSAWATLTDRERIAVQLRYADGLKQLDIARAFGVRDPQVSRILTRAVDKLRRALRGPDSGRPDPSGDSEWTALRDAIRRHLETSAASGTPVRHDDRESV